jgi:hypothetical protein
MTLAFSVAIALLSLAAARVDAAPTLSATSWQEARRFENFAGIPVWEPIWWVTLKAKPDGAPLVRIEYRGGFTEGELRSTSGTWDVSSGDRDGFTGRVRVSCAILADYDDPVRIRFRLVDNTGATSDWAAAEFPPDSTRATLEAGAAPNAPASPKKIGAVTYLAGDELPLATVRKELERQARLQGGTDIADIQVVPQGDGRSKVTASVMQAPPTPAAPPPQPAKRIEPDEQRILAEIKLPIRRR